MGDTPEIQVPLGFDLDVDGSMMINGLGSSASTVENGVYVIDETIVSTSANGGPLWTTIKAVATADLPAGIFGVAQGIFLNGLQGQYRWSGVMKVRTVGTTDIAAGDELIAVNAQNYLVKGTSGASNTGKCIAKALEANATDTTPVEIWVAFKGVTGFGHCFA